MRDLPIEFDEQEDNEPIADKRVSGGVGAAGIFMCFVASVLSAVAVSFLMVNTERKAEVLEIVGVKGQVERRVNPLEPIISELKTTNDQQAESIAELGQQIASLRSELNDRVDVQSLAGDKLSTRLTTLERFASDLSVKVDEQKKRAVIAQKAASQKPIEPPKPKVTVSVNSVRSINGTYWVSLRTPSESSPLLTLQDQWRGLKVLDVKYNQGVVVLLNNGITETVSI